MARSMVHVHAHARLQESIDERTNQRSPDVNKYCFRRNPGNSPDLRHAGTPTSPVGIRLAWVVLLSTAYSQVAIAIVVPVVSPLFCVHASCGPASLANMPKSDRAWRVRERCCAGFSMASQAALVMFVEHATFFHWTAPLASTCEESAPHIAMPNIIDTITCFPKPFSHRVLTIPQFASPFAVDALSDTGLSPHGAHHPAGISGRVTLRVRSEPVGRQQRRSFFPSVS